MIELVFFKMKYQDWCLLSEFMVHLNEYFDLKEKSERLLVEEMMDKRGSFTFSHFLFEIFYFFLTLTFYSDL